MTGKEKHRVGGKEGAVGADRRSRPAGWVRCGESRGEAAAEGRGKRGKTGRARSVGRGNIRRAGGGKLGKTVRRRGGKSRFSGKGFGGRKRASAFGNALPFVGVNHLCERADGGAQSRISGIASSWEHLARSAAFCEGQHPSGCRALACCRALFSAGSPV